jgi:hypothetical protein
LSASKSPEWRAFNLRKKSSSFIRKAKALLGEVPAAGRCHSCGQQAS